jgi:hypothetical protein
MSQAERLLREISANFIARGERPIDCVSVSLNLDPTPVKVVEQTVREDASWSMTLDPLPILEPISVTASDLTDADMDAISAAIEARPEP